MPSNPAPKSPQRPHGSFGDRRQKTGTNLRDPSEGVDIDWDDEDQPTQMVATEPQADPTADPITGPATRPLRPASPLASTEPGVGPAPASRPRAASVPGIAPPAAAAPAQPTVHGSSPHGSSLVEASQESSAPRLALPSLDGGDEPVDEGTSDGGEPDHYVGTTLGDRYVIDKVLGEGGMGKVYRARHKIIEKKVAIKILHAELAKDKEAVGRFLREARAASSIGNPHIVDIQDFGEAPDGSTYFVMEYLNGESLGDRLERDKRLPHTLVCDLALQLCEGLGAAHAQQIVHRDLKPDNIILVKPSGTWAGQGLFCKILDFGIAKVSTKEGTTKLTMAGAVFGTPHYMSPEQAAGEAIDHRTDIYSIGVMLYEMVSGEMPFNADNFMGILTQHMYKPPPAFRTLPNVPDCPAALEAVILKCLAKKREGRYGSMEELAEDLRKLQQTGQSRAAEELAAGDRISVQVDPELLKPRRTGLWLGAAALLLVGGGAAYVVMRGPAAGVEADAARSAAAAGPSAAATAQSGAPSARQVLVISEPKDAIAVVDGNRIALPANIAVVAGTIVSMRVEAEDYEPRTISLGDDSPDRVSIVLRRKADASAGHGPHGKPNGAPAASATPPTPVAPQPARRKPNAGSDGIVDPWK